MSAQPDHSADRPGPRPDRPPHPEEVVERIRWERQSPEPHQWDYLHLLALREGVLQAALQLPRPVGPVLDVFCGTQPYRELIPSDEVWGLDIDLHFGRADVLGDHRLPFRDEAFQAVLCTQALHLVDDPPATVAEFRRVLAPGGRVIVTVPRFFFRPLSIERRWKEADVAAIFAAWDDVRIAPVGGFGAHAAYVLGHLLDGAARRLPLFAGPARLGCWVVNTIGAGLEVLARPLVRRSPHVLVVTAARP